MMSNGLTGKINLQQPCGCQEGECQCLIFLVTMRSYMLCVMLCGI